MHDDDSDLLSIRDVLAATGMPRPSYESLRQRGQLGREFIGGPRKVTRRGFYALALYRAMTERKIEIVELDPNSCIRWADYWLQTRGAAKPIHELWIRYYGRPGDAASKVSILPNADVLSGEQPAPGATVTIIFDLDQIFGRAEQALQRSAGPRDPLEVFELPENSDG